MDNLTHSLVGLAAAKAGLERLSPGSTAMCVIAANAPDADILFAINGRWAYLHNHRGITHSIIGTLALALIIPLLFWLGDSLISRIFKREGKVKLRGLLIASIIVTATHPILDWTNNYGVRPLLPWNSKWFYGDFVFIVDPWIWLVLGGACFLSTSRKLWQVIGWTLMAAVLTTAITVVPMIRAGSTFPLSSRLVWLVGIVLMIVAYRLHVIEKWGSRVAIASFAIVVVYWVGLSVLHIAAVKRAYAEANVVASSYGESTSRLVAMPVLANPIKWQCVFETGRATYRFDISLFDGRDDAMPVRYAKLEGADLAVFERASRDERAKVFLDFARFPVVKVTGDCKHEMLVEMADLRYTEPGAGRRGTFSLNVPVKCADAGGESIPK